MVSRNLPRCTPPVFGQVDGQGVRTRLAAPSAPVYGPLGLALDAEAQRARSGPTGGLGALGALGAWVAPTLAGARRPGVADGALA